MGCRRPIEAIVFKGGKVAAADCDPEADCDGDCDRFGRTVWRGGADHYDGWGGGVADWAAAADERTAERTTLLVAGAAAGMSATFSLPAVCDAACGGTAAV